VVKSTYSDPSGMWRLWYGGGFACTVFDL